ncbi:MAG TPA: chemotaxis-specific protein-glutamate methyltransferase CheB [Polyangia bacterium]|nr:chemotaxis-specific protein-glutamate methyltransferase CheB [Polyangia bacterium]
MPRLRVLVVEDSLTVRHRLVEVLASDPELELVGQAVDGKQAIERCLALRPDVITMDMMLPGTTGLAATEYIMAHRPTPILIVSSSTNRGELFRTYEALAAGAVDVLEKPRGDEAEGTWERRFLTTLKLVARIRVITHLRARLRSTTAPLQVGPVSRAGRDGDGEGGERGAPTVIAIGASTGGPGAIVEILRALPTDFRIPILLVLHIGEPFGAAFADWLDGQTSRRVSFAVEGQPLQALAGRAVMAPPDQHLILRDGRLHLTHGEERYSCRPSVDVLFESVARSCGNAAVGCLLTGMGRDGASGLLEIRRAGGITIAQDEATSVVYGMPREAVLLGAAQRVLPLAEIGRALAQLASPPEA